MLRKQFLKIDADDISNIQIVSGENTFDFSHGDDTLELCGR